MVGAGQYTKFMWIIYRKYLSQYEDIIPEIGLEGCLGPKYSSFNAHLHCIVC